MSNGSGSLSKKQKEIIGLLQVGTFLEYFDLMLYVHMAVLLNELFFPKTDSQTKSLIAAFAFCSTYVLRPFGALLFGYIGDHIGRKTTVVFTTMMMALSCVVMASVPTYAQIGIAATWIVIICRVLQGLSSMGEVIGAVVYLTETIKHKSKYISVALIALSTSLGGTVALGVASLTTIIECNWRIAFWIGATIAVVGSIARTRLRETPDFIAMKNAKILGKLNAEKIKFKKKESVVFFLSMCSSPLLFFTTYLYFNKHLAAFGYTPADIIVHNFVLSIISMATYVLFVFLVLKIHPLDVVRIKAAVCLFVFCSLPFLVYHGLSLYSIFSLQVLFTIFKGGTQPAESIFIERFRVDTRLTITSFSYALSRAVVHIISSFGLIFLSRYVGDYALCILGLPVIVAYYFCVKYIYKTHDWANDHDYEKGRP